MDVYYDSPPLPSNPALQCSIQGCSRLLSDESTNDMCDPCRSLHARKTDASVGVSNWIDERFPSTSDPPPSAATHPAPTTLPIWAQPRLLSNLAAHLAASSTPLSISELANALLMPTTDQHIQPQLLPAQSDSGSAPIISPVASSSAEVQRTDGSSEQHEEQLDSEPGQMRVCSVRACKQTVPVGYEYKMCPACRVRYQKYGTTKRAKWKVEREKEKEKQIVSTVTEDSELPRVFLQPHPTDVIEDTENKGTPLPIPRPADETTTQGGTNIETEVPTGVPERDHMATTAPSQQPSADEHIPSVLPQPLPLMQHRPPPHSTATRSSPPSLIHDQVRRPSSNPPTTGYLEADPIVNGFSKFRVELFEGESDGRHPEGTVLSAPHLMKLGEPSNTRTDLSASGSSDSSRRKVEMSSSGEDHVKDASGLEPRESPGSCGNMTRPIVPVSLTACHPVMSQSEIQAAPCSPSQGQDDSQSQSTKDGPSTRPPSTTPVPAPRSRGRRKPRVKPAITTPTTGPPPEHAGPLPPPHPHPGYPAPHPYLYPYYPMYFPPYPGAYQYPYFPMPFTAPPPSPPKTKKKKKPSQVADVPSTPLPHPHPHPHPGSAYHYPPGPSGAWAYPTPLHPPPLPPILNSFRQESKTSASPVDPVPPPQPPQSSPPPPPPPPPAAAATSTVYAIPAPYSVPPLQRPLQSHDPSASTPPVSQSYPHPHLSGTQPYSGTPLTTLMPVPFFPAAALSSASASASASAGGTSSTSRKDKGKEAGPSTTEDGVRSTGGEMRKEVYHQQQHQQQPHVQMQFNYYHYGMGTSQSPTTPETHARRKRRKVDPNYREKMEILTGHATVPAENVDSALPTAPVGSSDMQGRQQQPPQQMDSPLLEKQPIGLGIGKIDDEESSRPTVRRCLNKRCTRALPNNNMDIISNNDSAICKRCRIKFGKRRERMKERFRLVPRRTVCEVLMMLGK